MRDKNVNVRRFFKQNKEQQHYVFHKSFLTTGEKVQTILYLSPFFVIFVIAGISLIGDCKNDDEIISLLKKGTILGSAVLFVHFLFLVGIQVLKPKYREKEVLLPGFTGFRKNAMALFLTGTLFLWLSREYWLLDCLANDPILELGRILLLLFLISPTLMLIGAIWINSMFSSLLISIYPSQMFKLKAWTPFGKRVRLELSIFEPVQLIEQEFLFKTRETRAPFSGSEYSALILEIVTEKKYLLYYGKTEDTRDFGKELHELTGWKLKMAPGGYLDRDKDFEAVCM